MSDYIDRLVSVNQEIKAQEKKEAKLLYNTLVIKELGKQYTYGWRNKVEEKIPPQLEETLRKAFANAFLMIFQKGQGLIDKTYDAEKLKKEYVQKRVAMQAQGDRSTINKTRHQGKIRYLKNIGFSTTEGIGLGALGIGLPDIPIFIGNLIRTCSVAANSYGIDVQRKDEQLYMLKLIRMSVLPKDERKSFNQEIEAFSKAIDRGEAVEVNLRAEIDLTANQLAEGMLFSHFVMGIPIVGVVGGLYNTVIVSRLQQLADLKYDMRLLKRCKYNLVQDYHREKGENCQ